MSERRANRRFVKSDGIAPVDAHQRPRDYLTQKDMPSLLAAALAAWSAPRRKNLSALESLLSRHSLTRRHVS